MISLFLDKDYTVTDIKLYTNNMGNYTGKGRSGRSTRIEMHSAVCDECGNKCEVPFKPSGDKPLYCSKCFEKHDTGRDNRSSGKSYGGGRDRGDSSRSYGGGRDRRDSRDNGRGFGGRTGRDRPMHSATCDSCGNKCEVPFKPTGDKPIYCDSCFGKDGSSSSSPKIDMDARFNELNEKLDAILKALKPLVLSKDDKKGIVAREKKVARTKKEEKLKLE